MQEHTLHSMQLHHFAILDYYSVLALASAGRGIARILAPRLIYRHPGPFEQKKTSPDGRCIFYCILMRQLGINKFYALSVDQRVAQAAELARNLPFEDHAKVSRYADEGACIEEEDVPSLAQFVGLNLAVHSDCNSPWVIALIVELVFRIPDVLAFSFLSLKFQFPV